jgi:2-polyprenyl-3-methyl-5-hydroxy-6-metoxy-1,4-benzoquinol methylase
MLITEEYRRLNAQKHEESANFGANGHKLVKHVREMARQIGAHTILDYGCGKRTLERELGYAISNYDPAIPGCDGTPNPADLVVCCDVLEHVEPGCLDDVLDDLKRLTKNTIMLLIDTQAANKHLPDGRNAHAIIEPPEWWIPKLIARWKVREISVPDRFMFALMTVQP